MRWTCLLLIFAVCSCSQLEDDLWNFDWQGHRGARAKFPENTTPGFFYALDQGMRTLEMDVVISADSMVVLSHEPFFSEEICLLDSLHADSLPNNLYQLRYSQIASMDCGSPSNERFPQQVKMAIAKPLLYDVIQASEAYAAQVGRDLPFYNIEIKSRPEWDGKYHPSVSRYAELVMQVVIELEVDHRTTIQSFDDRPLQYLHDSYADLNLALLVEDDKSPEQHLEQLGFAPDIYSCYYPLVDEHLVQYCGEQEMKLIPWTVNDSSEIRKLIKLGVDGVITDFPQLRAEMGL